MTGSEVLIASYLGLAFLSLYAYSVISQNDSKQSSQKASQAGADADLIASRESIAEQVDPITFGLKLLFIATFVISIIGLGKGVIESYDPCYLTVANSTLSGNTTSYEYAHTCFENINTEDVSFYKLVFFVAEIVGFLLLIGMIWQLFLFIKNVVWKKVKGMFVRRK